MRVEVTPNNNVKYDDTIYAAGTVLEIEDAAGKALVEAGAAVVAKAEKVAPEPAKEPEVKAAAKTEAKRQTTNRAATRLSISGRSARVALCYGLRMSIPVQYFQAMATAIPTLVIAITIGLRSGNLFKDLVGPFSKGRWRYATLIICLLIPTIIVFGEFAALHALLAGFGTALEALAALFAAAFCLMILLGELINPMLEHFGMTTRVNVSFLPMASILPVFIWFFVTLFPTSTDPGVVPPGNVTPVSSAASVATGPSSSITTSSTIAPSSSAPVSTGP